MQLDVYCARSKIGDWCIYDFWVFYFIKNCNKINSLVIWPPFRTSEPTCKMTCLICNFITFTLFFVSWNTGFHFIENSKKVLIVWVLDPPTRKLSDLKYDLQWINSKCCLIFGNMWVQAWNTSFYQPRMLILAIHRHKNNHHF